MVNLVPGCTPGQSWPLGLRSKVPQSYVKYYSTDNIKYGKYHKRIKNTTDLKIVGFLPFRCRTSVLYMFFFSARACEKSASRRPCSRWRTWPWWPPCASTPPHTSVSWRSLSLQLICGRHSVLFVPRSPVLRVALSACLAVLRDFCLTPNVSVAVMVVYL